MNVSDPLKFVQVRGAPTPTTCVHTATLRQHILYSPSDICIHQKQPNCKEKK